VPEPSISEVAAAIGKLKMNMLSGTDQIQAGGGGGEDTVFWDPQTYYADLKQWIASPEERISCHAYSQIKVIKLSVLIIEAYHCCQLHT
jgi:hypothetical protein